MKLSIFLLPLVGVLTTQIAWAEGSTIDDGVQFGETAGARAGNNGVNRVVRTVAGYRAVQGTVALSFVMPKNENAGNHSYERVNATGSALLADLDGNGTNESGVLDDLVQPLNRNTNANRAGVVLPPKGNKPSAYLGGTLDGVNAGLRTHIDAGLQYEPLTLYNAEPGWSAFFRVSGTRIPDAAGNFVTNFFTNPRVPNGTLAGQAWRSQGSGANNEITSTMLFEARDSGSGRFDWSPVGTIYANLGRNQLALNDRARWNVDITAGHPVAPWGDATQRPPILFNTRTYNTADVKRVTALTRDEPYTSQLDGSQVRAEWSACQVTPHDANLRNWVEADVNQGRTGYDAPREGDIAFDRRYDTHRTIFSRPIVEFAPITQPQPDGSTRVISSDTLRREMGTGARYLNETVVFNFGTLVRPVGGELR